MCITVQISLLMQRLRKYLNIALSKWGLMFIGWMQITMELLANLCHKSEE